MKLKETIFACLNCGADTGCPNKLVCDKCRIRKNNESRYAYEQAIEKKKRLHFTRYI